MTVRWELEKALLPEATAQPCNDCPWRRNALPGWLGPFTADEWLTTIHGDMPVACHQTIPRGNDEGWAALGIRQCRGAASFRAHICKLPRDIVETIVGKVHLGIAVGPPDTGRVFATDAEFRAHHKVDDR